MLSEETKKSIGDPENYLYIGKCNDWKSMEGAEKYLERVEKRLLDYNNKDKKIKVRSRVSFPTSYYVLIMRFLFRCSLLHIYASYDHTSIRHKVL